MKYELTGETITHKGRTLHQIKAAKRIRTVLKGDLGGYIESEENLAQQGSCWVGPNAKVYGGAKVLDDAQVLGTSEVYDKSMIRRSARLTGNCDVQDCTIQGQAILDSYTVACRVIQGNAVLVAAPKR